MNGRVFLVGAGPGDPELLTLKAVRILGNADAVLHDDLVSPEVLHLVPEKALRYDVGKRCGRKSMRQEEIHFLMIELARQDLNVVRLKGGDPLVFGRAGEEIIALRRAGIDFQVIPGVSAAFAAAASAEIPLTLRGTSSSLLLMAGHLATDQALPDLRALLKSGTTIALYMPGADPQLTIRKLTASGLQSKTPCAVISRASTPAQNTVITTLAELASITVEKPSILILGDVIRLAKLSTIEIQNLAQHLPSSLLDDANRLGALRGEL